MSVSRLQEMLSSPRCKKEIPLSPEKPSQDFEADCEGSDSSYGFPRKIKAELGMRITEALTTWAECTGW